MKSLREQIIEILKNNYGGSIEWDFATTADEILALSLYPAEFINWIGDKGIELLSCSNDDRYRCWYYYKYNSMEVEKEFYSLEQLYEYWKLNIRDIWDGLEDFNQPLTNPIEL